MKTRACTAALVGVGAVVVMALLPRGSYAQTNMTTSGGSNADGTLPPGGPPGSSGDANGTPPPGGQPGGSSSDDETARTACAQNGSSAHYEEFLAGDAMTMTRWAVSYTACPNHVNWNLNPNPAREHPSNTSIPAYPMLIEDGGVTDLSEAGLSIGIMLNGVAMFSSWARFKVVEYEDTAFYLEADAFDPCGGHATDQGSYHYHGTAGCLQEQAGAVAGEHSPLIGWAFDGFPFYGQLGPGGVEMKVCGADGADSTVCLDACMGYEGEIAEDDFSYRYYTSCGFNESFFPFTPNCYRGCCPIGMVCSDKLDTCGSGAENGFTTEYVPVAATPMYEMYDTAFLDGNDTDYISSDYSVDCSDYLGSGGASPTPSPATETTSLEAMTTTGMASPMPVTTSEPEMPMPTGTASPGAMTFTRTAFPAPANESEPERPLTTGTASPEATSLNTTSQAYAEVGCFVDKPGEDRIKINQLDSETMTAEACHNHCQGSTFFGLQWGVECWCEKPSAGSSTYPFNVHGESTACNMPCSGDAHQTCGGFWAMTVYKNI